MSKSTNSYVIKTFTKPERYFLSISEEKVVKTTDSVYDADFFDGFEEASILLKTLEKKTFQLEPIYWLDDEALFSEEKPNLNQLKMKLSIEELNKHYDESKLNYNIKGESHLDYYKEKFSENYAKLLKHTNQS